MANRSRSAGGKSRDRISMLPDELLVCILSRLNVEEAIATSLLSRRWKGLWILISRLDFDGTNFMLSLKEKSLEGYEGLQIDEERLKYIRRVNRVIALSKSPVIEKFRVLLDLRKGDSKWIDEWVIFALGRKVERLELNLTNDTALRMGREDEELYTFPYHLLHLDSVDFKSLKSISLNNVNVDGETLEFFLCTFPLLEELSVSGSLDLMALKVVAPFPPFKRLEISVCPNLASVEIRDANLVCLKYKGRIIDFVLVNVPLLVDLCVEADSPRIIDDILSPFSSIFLQLRKCTLTMPNDDLSWEVTRVFFSFVQMRKLEQLVVRLGLDKPGYCVIYSFQPLTNLLRVSRRLQRLVVEFWHVRRTGCTLDYSYSKDSLSEVEKDARSVAKTQLRKIVPPTIKLEILDVI